MRSIAFNLVRFACPPGCVLAAVLLGIVNLSNGRRYFS